MYSSLVIFVALVAYCQAKIYDHCSLASELVHKHSFPKEKIADWICLVEHESRCNTAAKGGPNTDGSFDHGLFQINDRYWCAPPNFINECKLHCNDLRNEDLSDDVRCAKKIFNVHGFNAWTAWKYHCKGHDVHKYIKNCYF